MVGPQLSGYLSLHYMLGVSLPRSLTYIVGPLLIGKNGGVCLVVDRSKTKVLVATPHLFPHYTSSLPPLHLISSSTPPHLFPHSTSSLPPLHLFLLMLFRGCCMCVRTIITLPSVLDSPLPPLHIPCCVSECLAPSIHSVVVYIHSCAHSWKSMAPLTLTVFMFC